MRKIRYEFLLIAGLIMTLGCATVFADGKRDKVKRPKNSGVLSIQTSQASYPVKINGKYVGMSGVAEPALFYLTPDIYSVEVEGPNGVTWVDNDVQIRKNVKHCICLKTVERTDTKACPYRVHVEGPDIVAPGEIITFRAINDIPNEVPLNYNWKVNGGRIIAGMGTPTITVDTTGITTKTTITADLDVNDGVYDAQCRQMFSVPTEVVPEVVPEKPKAYICDEFPSKAPDDDKARLDNCAIAVQNLPDAMLYIIIHQGTDRAGKSRNTYDRVSKRAMQYLVNVRGIDPRKIQIVRGPDRPNTTYVMWIVPPGAELPVSGY